MSDERWFEIDFGNPRLQNLFRVYADSLEKAQEICRVAFGYTCDIYEIPEPHDFSWALTQMKMGKQVQRIGWPTAWLYMPDPDVFIISFYVRHPRGIERRRYAAMPHDLRATDWEIAPERLVRGS